MKLFNNNLRIFIQNSPGSNHITSNNCPNLQQQQQQQQPNNQNAPDTPDDDIWRGHSIAALRRRASELNATSTSIPSYLHAHNYEHHNSVY